MVDALFGSKTRVKLLHLFFNNPGKAFYVREITRKIDEQINSVRRELANMLSVGVIKSDSANNKLYYEVDSTYEHYKPLRQIFADNPIDEERAVEPSDQRADQARLKQLGDLRVAILSGSLVHHSASKVDVLLVGRLNKTQVRRYIKELEAGEGRELNYSVMPYDDFYYRLSVKDKFITEIVSGKHILLLDTEDILKG